MQDEDDIKFLTEIFIQLCGNNIQDIVEGGREDLLKIILDLSLYASNDSK